MFKKCQKMYIWCWYVDAVNMFGRYVDKTVFFKHIVMLNPTAQSVLYLLRKMPVKWRILPSGNVHIYWLEEYRTPLIPWKVILIHLVINLFSAENMNFYPL